MRRFFCSAILVAVGVCASAQDMGGYILTGQSNSLGAVKGSPASAELTAQYASDALLWNGNMMRDTGACFEKSPVWQPVAPQLPRYSGNLCMGPEYAFCRFTQNLGNNGCDTLGVIKASLDGGGNSYWLPGSPAYESVVRTVRAAIAAVPGGRVKVLGVLYLQGESDEGEEITQARQRLSDFLRNLEEELKGTGADTTALRCYVVGQPADWHGKDTEYQGRTTADELRKLTESRADMGWVYTRDLPKIRRGDGMGVHYDGVAQLSIGARFAYTAAVLHGQTLPQTVRNAVPDVPLNSPAAWWGNILPVGDAAAHWDISSAVAEHRITAPLHLGGIRIADTVMPQVKLSVDSPEAVLMIGERGISLLNRDLMIRGNVCLTSVQEWKIPTGQRVLLRDGTLSGSATLCVSGGGVLELCGICVQPGVSIETKDGTRIERN